MTIQVDQTATISGALDVTVSCSFATLPDPNSLLVVAALRQDASTPVTITDNNGNNTYIEGASIMADSSAFQGQTVIYYVNKKLSLPGSPPFTITFSDPTLVNYLTVTARTYKTTVAGTFVPDTAARNTNTAFNATSISVASGSPYSANQLFVSAVNTNSGGSTEGIAVTGLSLVNAFNDGQTGQVGGMADLIATDQLFKTASWSWSSGILADTATAILPFYVAPALQKIATTQLQAVKRAAFR